ncbi:mediator of RNA polymerase II transcription subunit 25-like protein [Tanacetum coccineum]
MPTHCILDAETVAKSFPQSCVSLSVICPRQLPKLKAIYNAHIKKAQETYFTVPKKFKLTTGGTQTVVHFHETECGSPAAVGPSSGELELFWHSEVELQTGKPNSLLTLFFALGSRDDSSKRMNVKPVLSSSITARWKKCQEPGETEVGGGSDFSGV